jgi:glutamine cyclotransferase
MSATMPRILRFVLSAAALCGGGCGGKARAPALWTYRVEAVFPHDPKAFTQGLVWADGRFYESTGRYGESTVREVDPATGRVVRQQPLPERMFGEGLALWRGALVQLTWQSGLGVLWDAVTFQPVGSFRYRGEGWGLTHDGRRLIMSDGTAELRFLDPATFVETGRLPVHERGKPVAGLNELEYVAGEIYANVWGSDRIARISPKTGAVVGWIDLAGLLRGEDRARADVLNGIAYDPESDRLFVTGKLWPSVFQVRLVRAPPTSFRNH